MATPTTPTGTNSQPSSPANMVGPNPHVPIQSPGAPARPPAGPAFGVTFGDVLDDSFQTITRPGSGSPGSR